MKPKMIIPSIDLMNGKAVQLRQGKEKILEKKEDPVSLAKDFNKYGEIAVIDLDAALGKGDNLELIKKICKVADCRVGGGIRTMQKSNEILAAGAKKIIIGTKASPSFLKKLPKDRVIIAIDTKEHRIVDKGWTRKTNKTPQMMIQELDNLCSEFLFTNVDKEGMMKGIDLDIIKKLQSLTNKKITAAGGITTIKDIQDLERLGTNSQIGMALYTGKISLDEAFVSVLDFKKNKGLIPTIVQDESGQVLTLAYSSKESLKIALKTGKGAYYSRSRKKLWVKGETSKNTQELIKARYDCDKDALLFTVKQKNFACHNGTYSCFGEKEFGIEELYKTVQARRDHPKKESYTSKLLKNEKYLKEKIFEETNEVINFENRENLIWEVADLTYFVTTLLAKQGISIKEVKDELWRRRR